MTDDKSRCPTPQKHPDHICQLRQQGLMQQIDQLAENPIVRCARCGAEANRRDVVCQPIEL